MNTQSPYTVTVHDILSMFSCTFQSYMIFCQLMFILCVPVLFPADRSDVHP